MNKTVYFLLDMSGSMRGSRADALNNAMRRVVDEAMPAIKANKASDLDIYFTVLGFRGEEVLEIKNKVGLDGFASWEDIEQDEFYGQTPTGQAIAAAIDDMNGGTHGDLDMNAAAPVMILVSDGEPNGDNSAYDEVMKRAEKGNPGENRLFRRSVRIAIGINVDDAGRESLRKFGNLGSTLLKAGIQAYYDCSEEYPEKLAEILKSATFNVSVN